ncbi:hypothetical protein [Phenylobacterium sp.]|uniref:hypothetical protein n=1 Tax=Phenylobacterium sp. TaxID=1871053 RepID=UPI002810AECF|nr:hypothetical protein [Phenylobacterium sp.]
MTIGRAQWATEVSAGFILDQIKFGRGLFDFLDALIVVAVTQANVELVLRDPALQRAYAAYDAPPPDELRRPISVNALAQSLRLPFETVRRRVSRLVLFGILKVSADGVWTPGAKVRSPLHRKVAEAGYARMLALRARLAVLPELQDLPRAEPWARTSPPLRAAARVSAEYLLRFVDLLTAEIGDVVDAAVWLEILRSNTAESDRGPDQRADRRAVRPALVARRLALPAETVRRRAAQLVSTGACDQVAAGLVISEEILARPQYAALAERNLADLRRMLAQLAQLGAFRLDEAQTRAAA